MVKMMSVINVGDGRAQSQPQAKPYRNKRSVACNHCRLKKVRCNGEQPICANCLDRGEKCVYHTMPRRKRKETCENSEIMLDRIARMEAMLKEANAAGPGQQVFREPAQDVPPEGLHANLDPSEDGTGQRSKSQLPPSPPHTNQSHHSLQWSPKDSSSANGGFRRESNTSMVVPIGEAYASRVVEAPNTTRGVMSEPDFQEPPHVQSGSRTPFLGPSYDDGTTSAKDKGVGSIAPPQNQHWEYHGPGSFLSICSGPGIDWVTEKTGVPDFAEIARTFSREIARPLKLDQKINPERFPEPDRETAWRYVRIYFEETPEASFDLVHRSVFESHLHSHFERGNLAPNEDNAAWYALRNVVYAFGIRTELGNASSSNFIKSQQAGWRYFENALSRHTELTFCRTGLMAVQALATMAIYVEGVGCPSLEYMLCSGAVRLAQAKGLHRQPGSAWGMSPEEIQQRNWIFWVLYSYEKQVAQRSGRASAIDDEDISCHIPTVALFGSSNKVDWSTYMIKQAQISSRIGKRFSTVQAYKQTPEQVVQVAAELDQELREWKDTLPPHLRPGSTINVSNLPAGMKMDHVLYLHYQYYGSLIGIHSTFTYPWSGIMFGRGRTKVLSNQVAISIEIVAEASRNIILATKYINDIYSSTPVWMAFYYPILGLINLFVHVLKHPTSPTALSDISLLEVGAGHFARLEFASSGELSFSFGREISSLARLAVKRAQQKLLSNNSGEAAAFNNADRVIPYQHILPNSHPELENGVLDVIELSQNTSNQRADSFSYAQLDSFELGEFDMENWSALLPSFSPQEMEMMNLNMGGDIDMTFSAT